MKKITIFTILIFIFSLTALHARKTETYFKFKVESRQELDQLTKIISIDNVKNGIVFAYANDSEFQAFEKLGYEFEILPYPSILVEPQMASTKDGLRDWDTYPTYGAYVDMMNQFAIDYPDICVIVNIGSSVEGRDLLFAKISDNVDVEEDEPEVMHTATMHGNETTGYVLMLRLIDSLLVAYGTDSLITRMVDSCEIWINPLANPDGTYNGGDHTVSGATRYNANGVDLNRNFPDPQDGDHPDGHPWQPETIAMMDLAEAHSFVISANHHGGAEVVNYPWDTWAQLHADDDWFIDISRMYADSAQYYSPSGYLNDLNNGITNGYAWYTINGGRQDYMNWWHGCREVTLELSNTMLLPASQLPAFWTYNRVSFLDYLENGLYGIRGLVTDSITGLPVAAKVTVLGHDFDHSEVYTDPDVGDYHRMIEAGSYNLQFMATGYITQTINSISVTDFNTTIVNVLMQPLTVDPVLVYDGHDAGEHNPGDTVAMKITLENLGGGNAYNVNATLATDDAYTTITQATSSYPPIAAEGGTATSYSDYEFIILPSSPDLRDIPFHLYITADGGFADTLDFNYFVGTRVVFYFDNFALDQGWSGLGGNGEWTLGPAVGGVGSDGYGGADPDVDHSPGSDNYVFGNDLNPGSGGDYNSYLSITYWVTSPTFDCTDLTGVRMTFYRWLGVEGSPDDHAYLQAFDGSSWVQIFENSATINESSWNEQIHDLSAYADGNSGFQIRFGMGSTDAYGNYCGWNIDDLELKGYGEVSISSPNMSYDPTAINDTLHMDESETDSITIYNTGDVVLMVRFSSAESWLDFSKTQYNISPNDSLILPVTISTEGLTPGQYSGSIEFTSNDTSLTYGSIPVDLLIFSPDIYLPQSSIDETLATNEQSTKPLVIVNNGPGYLNYEISRQMFSGKQAENEPLAESEPIGYRSADIGKSIAEEPYFAPILRNNGGPDDWGYSWIDSDDPLGPAFDWIDISSIGTEVPGLGDDDTTAVIPIGFGFPFYENVYTELIFSSNGIITFGSGSKIRTNSSMPDTAQPNNMIAMWWDDLDPRKGGNIYYYYDSANNRFIISFIEIRNYYSTTGTGSLTFQVILQSNGKIYLQYDIMNPGVDADSLSGATIGIENSAGDDGLEVAYNAPYMHDTLAILFSAGSWLAVEPTIGTVEPYDDDTIDVNFDASDLDEGLYDGQLTINSNDPDSPSLIVPVTLTVENEPTLPDEPTLVSPADEADSLSQPIIFDWANVGTADLYQLQIDTDSLFGNPTADTSITTSLCEISGLVDSTTYFWHVRAHNTLGWGDWSLTRSFTTEIGWICGDVNSDGIVNVFDATFLISYLYMEGPPPATLESANVNNDDTINIFDITYLISYLYMEGPAPDCP
jgi:hypothetical protein